MHYSISFFVSKNIHIFVRQNKFRILTVGYGLTVSQFKVSGVFLFIYLMYLSLVESVLYVHLTWKEAVSNTVYCSPGLAVPFELSADFSYLARSALYFTSTLEARLTARFNCYLCCLPEIVSLALAVWQFC